MPIELVWDDALPHVIHYHLNNDWTWEDFRLAALKEHALGEGLNGVRYDVIGNLSRSAIPIGPGISNVVRLFDKGPQNRRTIVVIGSTLARLMIGAAGKIYPQTRNRFYSAETLAEAREFIVALRTESTPQ